MTDLALRAQYGKACYEVYGGNWSSRWPAKTQDAFSQTLQHLRASGLPDDDIPRYFVFALQWLRRQPWGKRPVHTALRSPKLLESFKTKVQRYASCRKVPTKAYQQRYTPTTRSEAEDIAAFREAFRGVYTRTQDLGLAALVALESRPFRKGSTPERYARGAVRGERDALKALGVDPLSLAAEE